MLRRPKLSPPPPATRARLAARRACGGALLALVLAAAGLPPAAALDYVNATPSGPEFPEWDGGGTELEFADIDGDGHVDLISIGDHGSPYVGTDQHGIMVYFTDGVGGWSIAMTGNFGYGGICAGDVNQDGLLDVGYGMHHNYSGTDLGDQLIEVALGDGSGAHWVPWDDGLAVNGESWGMGATDFADFDNDGLLDIVANSFGCCNGVRVYRNNGDGTWTQTYALAGGNSSMSICTGDVNGDGFADIAAAYQHGCIFLGDGEGGFVSGDAGLPGLGSLGLDGVALGDVDGDGCDDLAFVQSGGLFVYLWRGDHWESASAGLPASGNYKATQLHDLDGDGRLDLAAMTPGRCDIWLGDGGGNWTAGGGFTLNSASSVAAFRCGGDIDHNGFADFALIQREGPWYNSRNQLYVYREASPLGERFVQVRFPHAHETFVSGSAQTIRWASARSGGLPAETRIELSTSGPGGPWTTIADGLPDNGHHQWIVGGAPTVQAHLRITVAQDGHPVSAVSSSFRILGSDPAFVAGEGGRGANGPGPGALRVEISPNPCATGAMIRLHATGSPEPRGGPEGGGGAGGGGGASSGAAALSPASASALTICDPAGRLVRRLDLAPAGDRGLRAWWDGRTESGAAAPPGVYFVRPGEGALRSPALIVLR